MNGCQDCILQRHTWTDLCSPPPFHLTSLPFCFTGSCGPREIYSWNCAWQWQKRLSVKIGTIPQWCKQQTVQLLTAVSLRLCQLASFPHPLTVCVCVCVFVCKCVNTLNLPCWHTRLKACNTTLLPFVCLKRPRGADSHFASTLQHPTPALLFTATLGAAACWVNRRRKKADFPPLVFLNIYQHLVHSGEQGKEPCSCSHFSCNFTRSIPCHSSTCTQVFTDTQFTAEWPGVTAREDVTWEDPADSSLLFSTSWVQTEPGLAVH